MIQIGLKDEEKAALVKRICKVTPNMLQSRLIELAESDEAKELCGDTMYSVGELLEHVMDEVEKDES